MADKTEDQIQREKEAVARMVGAKSAMEAALQRIATLEEYGRRMACVARELERMIGDDAWISSRYHNPDGKGAYCSDVKHISARGLIQQINAIQADIFKQA